MPRHAPTRVPAAAIGGSSPGSSPATSASAADHAPDGDVDQRGRPRAGALGHDLPREVVDQQLRQQHQVAGPGQLVAVVGRHLEQGVERLELDPGAAVQRRLAARPVHDLPVAGGAVVPVRERRGHQVAPAVEQPVVDAPRVHPDGRHRTPVDGQGQAAVHLGDQAVPVPAEVPPAVGDGAVGVAVHHLDRPRPEVDPAHPDRGRAEVDGDDDLAGGHRAYRPVARASLPRAATVAAR